MPSNQTHFNIHDIKLSLYEFLEYQKQFGNTNLVVDGDKYQLVIIKKPQFEQNLTLSTIYVI